MITAMKLLPVIGIFLVLIAKLMANSMPTARIICTKEDYEKFVMQVGGVAITGIICIFTGLVLWAVYS